MCYWTESPPGGKKPENCSGGELAWVSDSQAWQFITTHLDAEIRTYSRLNLGIYSTPITGTQINTGELFTLYGERLNWTDPNLKDEDKWCVVLSKDVLKNEGCYNGGQFLCQSSNISVCVNRTMISNKCYWIVPKLDNSKSIYAKEKECIRLGGTLAVPESNNISDTLGLEFPNDSYYIGIVRRLWYDLYTGEIVWNHFWEKDGDSSKDDCAIMRDSDTTDNWRTRSCSSSFRTYSGLCVKDIRKDEMCPENNTNIIGIYNFTRCYWFTSEVKDMESAKQLCEDSGGYLSYGRNDEEQTFLLENGKIETSYVRIGITTAKRRWYNTKGEQSWFNWDYPYSRDNCVTFSAFDGFKWSMSCSEPVIPGLTTSAPKKGPAGGGSTEASMTTGNLCMKEDSSVISTTMLTTTTVENPTTTEVPTTTQPTTEAPTTTEPTTEAPTTTEPTTEAPTTTEPTTEAPTTTEPTTEVPTTTEPTTEAPTTQESTTEAPTTEPTTEAPTTELTTETTTTQESTTTSETPKTSTIQQTTSEPTTEAQLSSIPKTSPKITVLPDPTMFKPIGFTKPTLIKDDKCHKIIVDPENKQSRSITCLCPCKRRKGQVQNLTEQSIEKLREETKEKLILPQQSISAVIQKKISLPDKRVSASTIGTASVMTIIGILLTLVLADLFKIFLEIKRRMRYISDPF